MSDRLKVANDGWLAGARHIASPNCDARPPATVVDALVIHHISLPPEHFSGDAIERFFTNRLDPGAHPYFEHLHDVHVSAHSLVRRLGALLQFVSCHQRAWHAGASHWAGETDINSCSIGIEIQNPGHEHGYPDFPPEQMQAIADLCRDIAQRRGIPPERVLAHSDRRSLRTQSSRTWCRRWPGTPGQR